jgi:coproporphyrinogen III oxidase
MPDSLEIANYFKSLQNQICSAIEKVDGGAVFTEDNWEHTQGGGGRSKILQKGYVLEKAGVNFSAVEGKVFPKMREALNLKGEHFFATGVSIVMHPFSPHVPIIHMNVRYFEVPGDRYWFGGGIDLTPIYIDDEKARFFHQSLKEVCDTFDSAFYPMYKQQADNYFYIPHREETRGIGGIFFDHLQESANHSKESIFDFVKAVGESFVPIYSHLINVNRDKSFTTAQKEWQLLRRGRYVEFNLVHDKGTKFGLDTGGRIESILMSLPEYVSWKYNHKPESGSAEEITLSKLKKGIDWC